MKHKNQLHMPISDILCIQKGITYCHTKIVNSLPSNILKPQNNKPDFKVALQRYLITYTFCSLEDFSLTAKLSPLNPNILMHGVKSTFYMALECIFILCILLCCIFCVCVVCFWCVCCFLALACMCVWVLSDIDIDWFHTQLSVDKYWICKYMCVFVCVMGFFFLGLGILVV